MQLHFFFFRKKKSPTTARTSKFKLEQAERKSQWPTGSSQAVPHPSTIPARRCLTSVIGRERVFSSWYGATPIECVNRGYFTLALWAILRMAWGKSRWVFQTWERSWLVSKIMSNLPLVLYSF